MNRTILNAVTQGNCVDVMAAMPTGSVDFILTDPPYITRYKDASGRTVANDDNADWLEPSFAQMHRVLKPDSFCVSFYGWPKIDLFFAAWKRAGFRVAGHLVFRKRYSSKAAYLQYRHEQAFLLLKGNPAFPACPLPDVMDWEYTGNRLHPTQKPLSILKPLITAFSEPGQLVLDPFAGSGSTVLAAQQLGRQSIGIELDEAHCRTANDRLNQNVRRAA
jgi:adenine-specific DNA-methyltransferase